MEESYDFKHSCEHSANMPIYPRNKIQVFISSKCGPKRYDKIRAELKEKLEATKLFNVYTFEGTEASTLPAGVHYSIKLEDCDVCIFLIDNKDGVTPGVQAEVDIVNKNKIKSLYYFCDQRKKKPTALEMSLMGVNHAKCKRVHSFNDLSQDSAQALIEDIIHIYHCYCTGKIILPPREAEDVQEVNPESLGKYRALTIPKTTLKNVGECRNYFVKFVLGSSSQESSSRNESPNEFDFWGLQFLTILFENQPIQRFNTAMFLDVLKNQQDATYHEVVKIRWQAIQYYFLDNTDKCIEYLESSLKEAKNTNQPPWVINDILIDLRNQQLNQSVKQNKILNPPAQEELEKNTEELYYPLLDRINESLNEKFIDDQYQRKIDSPFTIRFGNDIEQYGDMLASALIVAMYNGSLTHILLIYKKIRNFIFHLACNYSDWIFKLNLYKLVIFDGSEKEIKGIQSSFPEILNKLSSEEAMSIVSFCSNHAVFHKRLNSKLLALGAVGYLLDDKDYATIEESIIGEIEKWLNSDSSITYIGQNVFTCLSGISLRINQDKLSQICCQYIDRHYSRWYREMFEFISNCIDLKKMSNEAAKNLVTHICDLLDNETDRDIVLSEPYFLCTLRLQDRDSTESLDKKVSKYFPKFYNETYTIVTTENSQKDLPIYINDSVERINKHNKEQSQEGVYLEYDMHEFAVIRSMLLEMQDSLNFSTLDNLIDATANTVLFTQESIIVKIDAILLLTCIAIRFPKDYIRNKHVYEKIYAQRDKIEVADYIFTFSNINDPALRICLQLLFLSMGKDVYTEFIEILPYIQGDNATTIAVTRIILSYLESSEDVKLPSRVESVILQNTLQWLHSEQVNIRNNATKILLKMSRNPDNLGIINQQLVRLIDSSSVHIKLMILKQINKINGITPETKKYVLTKCSHDANFVVRMAYKEIQENRA